MITIQNVRRGLVRSFGMAAAAMLLLSAAPAARAASLIGPAGAPASKQVSGALVTAISKINRDQEAERRQIEHDDDLSPNDKKAALARVFNVDVDSVVDVHEMDSDITVARVIREPANGEPHQS